MQVQPLNDGTTAAVEDSDSDTGKTVKLQAIRRLCNRLNCWRVNESWIVDITEFLTQKLSAVLATKSLLELGGDKYDK